MKRQPPRSTLLPYTTLFRSDARMQELDTAARATRNVVSGVLGAGARAFIGAQWEVDDKAAATFARAVYRELLVREDRKSTRLNSSHANISYAVFCLKTYKAA